jgi:hypothetical protein
VYQPASGIEPDQAGRIERYLDAVRSTLLFAKGVILVEGQAELIMIPALVKAVFGVGLDELGISVVSMNSAFFEHIAVIFGPDRIRRPCAIVSDLDESLVELPEDPDDDDKAEEHARNAQEVGERRRVALDALVADNPWLDAFLAGHTFEVDFIDTANAPEVIDILDQIYSRAADIRRVKTKLKSDELEVSGSEILRLANKVGKGWFALLLSEALTAETYIPEYISRALAFASHGRISPKIIKQIGLYRIHADSRPEELDGLDDIVAELEDEDSHDFISRYREAAPDDELTHFCNYIEEMWPE